MSYFLSICPFVLRLPFFLLLSAVLLFISLCICFYVLLSVFHLPVQLSVSLCLLVCRSIFQSFRFSQPFLWMYVRILQSGQTLQVPGTQILGC